MEKVRQILELMDRPAFCADGGRICAANDAALARQFTPGEPVEPMLTSGQGEFREFSGGCLCLSLEHCGESYSATVTALEGLQIFRLDPPETDAGLRLLALAAQELRQPLGDAMSLVEELESDSEVQSRLSRSLHQLLRMVSNMSGLPMPRLELVEMNSLLRELWEKVQPVCEKRGVECTFEKHPQSLYTCADGDLLTRAIQNLLSNALKFTAPGGKIRLALSVRGHNYRITLSNTADGGLQDPFHRFCREPGVGDGRSGLGLGMKIVYSAAAAHGGTVLMDQSGGGIVRVQLSMPIRQSIPGLKSPRYRISYTGERDPMLIELADVLPPEFYRK